MKTRTTGALLAPILVLAVGLGAGACNVEVPTGDSDSPAASSRPTASSSPDTAPSVLPTSTTSGPNSRSKGAVDRDIPADYVLPQDIKPGTCYLQLPDTYDLSDAKPIDCADPHFVEIVATFTWPAAYVDTIVNEYDNQIARCEGKFKGVATTAGYDWVARGASGSKSFSNGYVFGQDHVWFASAAQLTAGEGIGYCAVTPFFDHQLMVGSLVAATYQGYAD
ncbi:MAG: hypothetical protein FWH11_13210 [Micrococcales bacterium]|nr:hypothetical protein [Micrococcales bacterium]